MSKAAIPFLLLGLGAGAMAAVQAAVNARLRQAVASPFQAALVSFLVGTVALAAIVAFTERSWGRASLAGLPWWAWTGGALGAGYITAAVILAPRVGSLALMAMVIAGQLLTALVLDHFGLLALPKVPISPARLGGAALLLAGLFLILRRGR
jgi:bacterial/archaeal transporter family-2 protein